MQSYGLPGQYQSPRPFSSAPQFSIPTGAFGNYAQNGPTSYAPTTGSPYAQANVAGFSGGFFLTQSLMQFQQLLYPLAFLFP